MDDFAFHLQGEGRFWPCGRADDEWTEGGFWIRLDVIGEHSGHCDRRSWGQVKVWELNNFVVDFLALEA